MFIALLIFLIVLALLALSAVRGFVSIRRELTGRSTYYKKKRGYRGAPSFTKTIELLMVTPHLRLHVYKGSWFWLLTIAFLVGAYALT